MELEEALEQYGEALAVKAQAKSSRDVSELDAWYRTTLRDLLAVERKPGPFMTRDELYKLMQWKLARGKQRPLLKLIESNAVEVVERVTREAFSLYRGPDDAQAVLERLVELKGVGPATASALLAAIAPADEPFMSDESMNALGIARNYDKKTWIAWRRTMRDKRAKEKADWTVEELEKAMWSQQVLLTTSSTTKSSKKRSAEDTSETTKGKAKARKRA